MLSTTVGQLLVNESLPADMRDYNRVLDKKGLSALLQQVAREHPEKYREISFKLNQLGQRSAQDQGGMSFGARHLRRSNAANETRKKIDVQLARVLEDDNLTDKQRADKIVRIVGREMEPQQKAILEEAIKNNNPLALQVLSGSRGKPMNLASLLGGDMLYADHRDEVIPVPVLRSYSEGLSPEEYWAGTYGARRGIIATKFATQEAGFLSKQLNQAGHRLVVMDEEGDDNPDRGLVADTDDPDNEGALLARDAGPYKRNTPLTPKILKHLKRLGKNRILVRSPLVGGSPEGGVYARDVGIREKGSLPGRGEQVGLQAAQALSEPISQGQLSAKHSGGVAGQEKAVGGFQYINQLIQVPKKMQGGAAHSELDGRVQRIEDAPAGGKYVTINDQKHFVGPGFDVKVKKGDEVEAGDLISNGIPNPSLIVKYKGVGEGRRYFVNEFKKAMASSGMQGHRRNIELLSRGLINHVKMTDETDEHAPDDIIPYSTLEHTYKPRIDHERLPPKKAVGQYLERPVLHYTIGTKIRPSMLKDFEEFGIRELQTHKDPPPFEPHMVRGMYQLQHDPDWMTQMYGSGLKKSLLESTARGATSKERGTSFVPSLAVGTDFGQDPTRAVIQPKQPYALPKIDQPEDTVKKEPENTFFGGRFKLGSSDSKQAAYKSLLSSSGKTDTQSLAEMTPGKSKIPNIPKPPAAPSTPKITPTPPAVNIQQPPMQQPPVPQQAAAPQQPPVPQQAAAPQQPPVPQQSPTQQVPDPVPPQSINPSIMPEDQDEDIVGEILDPNSTAAFRTASNVSQGMRTATKANQVKNLANVATNFNKTINVADDAAKFIPGVAKTLGATGKVLGPAGVVLEGVGVGYNIYDKVQQGDTLRNAWSEQADEHTQNVRDVFTKWHRDPGQSLAGAAGEKLLDVGSLISPVSHAQAATELVMETGGGIKDMGVGAYNYLTDAEGKQREQNMQDMRDMQAAKQEQLGQQSQQVQQQIQDSLRSGSPEQAAQLQAQYDELQAQINDARQLAANTVDDTENWKLFDQHWVTGGGDYFRDNAEASANRMAAGLEQQRKQYGDNITAAQEAELAERQVNIDNTRNLVSMYDRMEAGDTYNKKDFSKFVRVKVQQAGNQLVDLQKRMREPGVQSDPNLMAQLKAEYNRAANEIEQYRRWARGAAEREVY